MSCFKVDVVEMVGSGTESSRSGREAEKRMVRSTRSGSASGGWRFMVGVRRKSSLQWVFGQPIFEWSMMPVSRVLCSTSTWTTDAILYHV